VPYDQDRRQYFGGHDDLGAAEASVAEAVVANVPEASRYELRLDGHLIGLASYQRRDSLIVFTHTEVEEALEGRGFGSRLAHDVLEDARRQGLEIVPACTFIAHYIERNPEYAELVARDYRGRA
jgi:uncharacterized protein